MTDLAAAADILRKRAHETARHLALRLPLGSPQTEVTGDLRFLMEIFAAGLELGSCGLVDRTMAWQKVRTRALGGDVEALAKLPALVAESVAPLLDDGQRDALDRLLENASTFVRFARTTNPVGHDPLLKHGTPGYDFLVAATGGDRMRAQAAARRAGTLPEALRTVIEPTQRELGRLWQNGLLPPGEEHLITQIVFQTVESLSAEQAPPPADAPLVAMVRAPGDEHSLGQLCAAAHVRGAGFRTRVVAGATNVAAIVDSLALLAPAAIAVTCTTALQVRNVGELIAAIRRTPALARSFVLLGGNLILDVPQLPTQLGADGGAYDGPTLAQQLRGHLLAAVLPRG